MAKKPLGLALNQELIDRIDAVRGDVSRTRWIERALEADLELRDDFAAADEDLKAGRTVPFTALEDSLADRAAHYDRVVNKRTGEELKVTMGSSQRFMCPKDCRPSFRPRSDKVRCPDCMSRVVPEPE